MATEKDRVPLSSEVSPAPTPAGAVFLSYASEDAAAAERITGALRAAGIEVWFDKSELRGGDAWDAAIRKKIKTCALFVPIVSKNTHARAEGYFRLEWHHRHPASQLTKGRKCRHFFKWHGLDGQSRALPSS